MKRSIFFPLLALMLLIASLFPVTPARAATTFTVNATDDNNDNGADYMSFYSGNHINVNLRPTLIIEYIP